MLDDDKRAVPGQPADQGYGAFGLGVAHAGGRLVQQDDAGAARDRHADLELALLGIGQKPRGHVAAMTEMDIVEDFGGALLNHRQISTFFQNA